MAEPLCLNCDRRVPDGARFCPHCGQRSDTARLSVADIVRDQTGEALSRIVSHVKEINTLVAQIAASSSEQSGGLQQVNTAVNQVDQITQQNAAMVEETNAASHALKLGVDELHSLVARFQVRQTAAAAPGRRPAPALRRAAAGGGWTEF